MKATAPSVPTASPKPPAPAHAPVFERSARGWEPDEEHEARMLTAVEQRATGAVQMKAAIDGGYTHLVAASRALPAPIELRSGPRPQGGSERTALAPSVPTASPKSPAPAPVFERIARGRERDEEREAHMVAAIARRVTGPVQTKAAIDGGYGHLVAASRANARGPCEACSRLGAAALAVQRAEEEAPEERGAAGVLRLEQRSARPPAKAPQEEAPGEGADDEEVEPLALQAKLAGGSRVQPKGAAAHSIPSPAEALSRIGAGTPLNPELSDRFSKAFGQDLGEVQIHRDSTEASAMGARAFTVGAHVAFAPGEFQPNTARGDRLISHELAHVIQQASGSPGVAGAGLDHDAYEAEADRAAEQVVSGRAVSPLTPIGARTAALQRKDRPPMPAAKLTVSLDGLIFESARPLQLQKGSARQQVFEFVLRRLLEGKYPQGLADRFAALPDSSALPIDPDPEQLAGLDPAIFECSVDIGIYDIYLRILKDQLNLEVKLPAEKEAVISLGRVVPRAFADVRSQLPAWYSKQLFVRVIGRYGRVLKQYAAADKSKDPAALKDAAAAIVAALEPTAAVVEATRADPLLASHAAYAKLWPGKSPAPADGPLGLRVGDQFLMFLETQLDLVNEVSGKDAGAAVVARKELLDRFQRFSGGTLREDGARGDQKIADEPGRANAEPHPATLTANPPITPPLFEASSRGFYSFTMALQWPTLWSAFQTYYYRFEQIQVPKRSVVNPRTAGSTELPKGVEPSQFSLLKTRLGRDTEYSATDLSRFYSDLALSYGSPGTALTLFGANALLRYAGSVISTAFQTIGDPSWMARFHFKTPGVYMIRATATPRTGKKAEVVRPPSVAYLPVFARSPELLAESRLEDLVTEQREAKAKIAEIDAALQQPGADKAALEQQKKDLKPRAGNVLDVLTYQQDMLTRRKQDKVNPPSKAELQQIDEQLEKLEDMIKHRGKRGLVAPERLLATFVADSGQVLNLLIEADDRSASFQDGKQHWLVSDSTTPHAGQQPGVGDSKSKALENGVRALLERVGYGRGNLSLLVDKTMIPIRIEASKIQILNEALSNIALAMSLVAVVAAPFTGGSSLYLLVPAGIIGAVPSAYRIIERNIDQTFKCDLDFGLDLVNILGAVVGLGAEAQLARRSIWLAGALLVSGVGVAGTGFVLMGAKLMERIKELENLPAGERAAALLDILGEALLQAGIMIGGAIAARGRLREATRAAEEGRSDYAKWRERSLDEPSRKELDARPEAAARYRAMDPVVRELLSTCGSFCIPFDVTPTQEALIKQIADKIPDTNDRGWFKAWLHENRGDSRALTNRLKQLAKEGSGEKLAAAIKAAIDPGKFAAGSFTAEGLKKVFGDKITLKDVQDKAAALVQAGKIPLDELRDILDGVTRQPGGNPIEILGYVEELTTRKTPGYTRVLGDLGSHFNFHKGARWMLRFISKLDLWSAVDQFEALEVGVEGRRWDAVIGGRRFQFKSWSEFYGAKFLSQILEDFSISGGMEPSKLVRWVFEAGLGTPEQIRALMSEALDRALTEKRTGFDADTVNAIKAALPDFVRVGHTL